jgi:hypothetical protein
MVKTISWERHQIIGALQVLIATVGLHSSPASTTGAGCTVEG